MIAASRGPRRSAARSTWPCCLGVSASGSPGPHRRVRARVEHVLARMKNWKILRDCRRRGTGVAHAAQGIALMHNLTYAGH
jgi:hypothetical protein